MEIVESPILFLVIVLISILLIIAAFWLPKVLVKQFEIPEGEKRASVEDSYRRTVAQVLGAAGIVVAWFFTWSKDNDARQQASVQSARQQYSELIKLLSSQKVEERAAGIYPMATLIIRLEYKEPLINLLKSRIKESELEAFEDVAQKKGVPDDVMAAIYVLGQLPCGDEGLHMEDLYLVGGNFKDLRGYCHAHFGQAKLFGANFSGADLTSAVFDGAQMSDWEFYPKPLTEEVVNEWKDKRAWERINYIVKFDYATLTGPSFKTTSVAGASFQNADLTKAIFDNMDLNRADFRFIKYRENPIFNNICYGPPGKPELEPLPSRHPC